MWVNQCEGSWQWSREEILEALTQVMVVEVERSGWTDSMDIYKGMLAGLDNLLTLVSGGERAVQNGPLDSGLYILVEGCAILADRGTLEEDTCGRGRNLLSPEEAGRPLDGEL